jgi:PPOX class probable F420-dependent enzyme
MSHDDAFHSLLTGGALGVLVTLKRDGRPQLSTVGYDYDSGRRVIRVSVTDDRAKTRNLRRDPRASFHVSSADGWSFVVAECRAELGVVTEDPYDSAADELVDYSRATGGERAEWDEFRKTMVAERRLLVNLHVERLYGLSPEALAQWQDDRTSVS